mmetsp:Transcript_2678/g.5738  ORF Transcript_2678/g.5738 Transcript_2678/m.5738 type:complete len:683 (-) Transcript_2678:198-2246(-)
MAQNEQSTTTRRRLNPFRKKPLWVILQEEQESAFTRTNEGIGNPENLTHHGGHETDDAIELPSIKQSSNSSKRNGPERSVDCDGAEGCGFSLEYSDDEGEQNSGLDANSSQSQIHDPNTHEKQNHSKTHHPHQHLHRHLSLFDLVSIGVGGTIGSGIFVLNGLIANQYAGPSTFLSWIISGIAAGLSGCCYAELSGRIPSAGSSYAYAFCALGELPAFVTACFLTLEFLLSGSAVARSWGDKVIEWLRVELSASELVLQILDPGYGINPMACLVSIATTILVLGGVKESKMVTDFFTWVKVVLVVFMTVGGFLLMQPSNLTPMIPPEFGPSGILRGAVSSFFGYLGFDAVCCVAGEAINAEVNLPRSIMITLFIVTTLYVAAAISLVGMQNYTEISPKSGFPEAFQDRGVGWASQITAAGEVFTLPVVVLISVIIQPRLQFALAEDGLIPQMFGELDSTGNPKKGTLFAGVIMTLFATFVPFHYLDDFVSAGILLAFTITNSSLVIMRRRSPESSPFLLEKLLAWFNLNSFLLSLTLSHGMNSPIGWVFAPLLLFLSLSTVVKISRNCPPLTTFGNIEEDTTHLYGSRKYFSTPCVPFIPCLGMMTNYFLISQLSFFGIALLVAYAIIAALFYFAYGARHSILNDGSLQYAMVERHEERHHNEPTHNTTSTTTISVDEGVLT